MTACCRFEESTALPQVNKDFSNIKENFNSRFFASHREKILANQDIDGCEKCFIHEKAGIKSLRELANQTFQLPENASSRGELSDIEYLEIFVGNACNLKCLTCGPDLSTAWQDDATKMGLRFKANVREKKDYKNLISQLPNLRRVKFVGGEPLYSKDHAEFISAISSDQAAKIELIYYTNATFSPKEDLRRRWKEFKNIHLWMSIDGFEQVNDYVRYPSKWSHVEHVAHDFFEYGDSHHNFSVHVNCTVSAYNIFSINPLNNWFGKMKSNYRNGEKSILYLNLLTQPDFLSPLVLPLDYRLKAMDALDQDDQNQMILKNFLNTNTEESLLSQFIERTRQVDKIRDLDIKNVIPELKSLF